MLALMLPVIVVSDRIRCHIEEEEEGEGTPAGGGGGTLVDDDDDDVVLVVAVFVSPATSSALFLAVVSVLVVDTGRVCVCVVLCVGVVYGVLMNA